MPPPGLLCLRVGAWQGNDGRSGGGGRPRVQVQVSEEGPGAEGSGGGGSGGRGADSRDLAGRIGWIPGVWELG